jgi:hypothetical protein
VGIELHVNALAGMNAGGPRLIEAHVQAQRAGLLHSQQRRSRRRHVARLDQFLGHQAVERRRDDRERRADARRIRAGSGCRRPGGGFRDASLCGRHSRPSCVEARHGLIELVVGRRLAVVQHGHSLVLRGREGE